MLPICKIVLFIVDILLLCSLVSRAIEVNTSNETVLSKVLVTILVMCISMITVLFYLRTFAGIVLHAGIMLNSYYLIRLLKKNTIKIK